MDGSRTPVRRCVACGARRPQPQLRRFRALDGELVEGRGPGRGAYTCDDEACVTRALERNLFARPLRAPGVRPPA
jgi:predicted RNA-binding protein YlxR (DUF448 family)